MNSKKLHIVSFNTPYPANYGGVIDVFYKLKALAEEGVLIYLHCFEYGREESAVLEQLCEKVFYYKRNMSWKQLLSPIPFIVKSRQSNPLLEQLKAIDAPILFEGHHCTSFLGHPSLSNRKQYVRTHNIEADYYKLLSKVEKNLFRKLYFYWEYRKLLKYEDHLKKAHALFTISKNDQAHFEKLTQSHYIKAFHPESHISSLEGIGEYAIYHGNLSVPENEEAVLFLIQKVFRHINISLVIAGKRPGTKLRKEALKHNHIRLVENPQDKVLDQLLQQAHIHVLPTFQDTGIKLKLLKSLYTGRHCIANELMVSNTELENTCIIANSPDQWIKAIKNLEEKEFNVKDIELRKKVLSKFDTKEEAKKIIRILFPQA